jgi:maleylpyruvate isomerase
VSHRPVPLVRSVAWPSGGAPILGRVPVPERGIDGCRQGHARLLGTLSGLTDEAARRASLLPEWTVGHVLTHIARNADSVVRRLAAAARDEVVDQYPGGAQAREVAIMDGAGRPAAQLVADVRESARAVEDVCAALPVEAWERQTRGVSGRLVPAWGVVRSRWHEVEVHHVDLGLGYRPADWPAEMVAEWLPDVLQGLPDRATGAELLAWVLGRGPAPVLGAWA